ncbi:MAG: TonB-dependent receptor [Gemmatimonadetes bacterium]|nr:TonB-dependent receptor [Gemmatimonadota bacterium]
MIRLAILALLQPPTQPRLPDEPARAHPPQAPDTGRRRAADLPAIEVIGRSSRLRTIPGSGFVLDAAELRAKRPRNLHDALRGAPGLFVRDEDGIGIRPNIGIRGLNPTRSQAVLLLEDGVPFSIAPYGDNASYYVPPIDRFAGVEVLKGASQIGYGPRTIGGVINLLSPTPPRSGAAGSFSLGGGNRDYRLGQVRYRTGAEWGGVVGDLLLKRAAAGRRNLGTTIADGTIKASIDLPDGHELTVKGNVYRERSQLTYSGLTEAEYAQDPFANVFERDSMFADRVALAATHRLARGGVVVTTRAYGSWFARDWWRQSSNSAQRPNDASDPACGGLANLATTCGNEGRLRQYRVVGVEPRALIGLGSSGHASLELGARAHYEVQDRRQENGASPLARAAGPSTDPNAGLRESNLRKNGAFAGFGQLRLGSGPFSVTPGLRAEYVRYQRHNRLDPTAPLGETTLFRLIPGIGVTWRPGDGPATVFGGWHRGFAPPRTEDVLTNDGGVVDLAAEESWNAELGVRYDGPAGLRLEATAFQLDFTNQIVPASVAGGSGATLTSAGETLHRGLEFAGRLGTEAFGATGTTRGWLSASWTWVAVARFESARYAWIGTGTGDLVGKVYPAPDPAGLRPRVSVTGNRLPYAPEHVLRAALGIDVGARFGASVEAVHTSAQFTDPVNTARLVADGQQGPIAGVTVWNASADWRIPGLGTRLSAGVKNLFDRVYLVDRSRGLMPGAPRLFDLTMTVDF